MERAMDKKTELEGMIRMGQALTKAGMEKCKQVKALQAELAVLKARQCETCRWFSPWRYTCESECRPLRCVSNDYSGWEAKGE